MTDKRVPRKRRSLGTSKTGRARRTCFYKNMPLVYHVAARQRFGDRRRDSAVSDSSCEAAVSARSLPRIPPRPGIRQVAVVSSSLVCFGEKRPLSLDAPSPGAAVLAGRIPSPHTP